MDCHMSNSRRTGYAYHGKGTPTLEAQEKALTDAECEVVFTDTAPSRRERGEMINVGLEPGDVVVICKTSIIGSGAKDTADVVRAICARGCPIEVLGCGERMYTSEEDIRNFAALALKTSRRINVENMLDRRVRSGPKAKLDALSQEEWDHVKFLWHHGDAKQQVAVDFCKYRLNLKDVTRVNIAQRIKREMMAGKED